MRKKLLALLLSTLMISSIKYSESINAMNYNECFTNEESYVEFDDGRIIASVMIVFLIVWAIILFVGYNFENSDAHKDRVSETEAVLTLGRMNGLTKEGGEMIIDTLLKNDLIAKRKVKDYWNRICNKFNYQHNYPEN